MKTTTTYINFPHFMLGYDSPTNFSISTHASGCAVVVNEEYGDRVPHVPENEYPTTPDLIIVDELFDILIDLGNYTLLSVATVLAFYSIGMDAVAIHDIMREEDY